MCAHAPAGGFSVFAGVGERTREGNDLYREMIESGVIKLGDKARATARAPTFAARCVHVCWRWRCSLLPRRV